MLLFGSEAVNASGKAVRGLVKSRIEFYFADREFPRGLSPSREYGGGAARPLTNPATELRRLAAAPKTALEKIKKITWRRFSLTARFFLRSVFRTAPQLTPGRSYD